MFTCFVLVISYFSANPFSFIHLSPSTRMTDLKAALVLCLLGLVAASLAEQTAEVDEDTGLERGVREVSEDVATDADNYGDVMNREKRHREWYNCLPCSLTFLC